MGLYTHEVIENSSFYEAMEIPFFPPNDQVGFILRRETLFSHFGILINRALEKLTSRYNVKVLCSLLTSLCYKIELDNAIVTFHTSY